MKLFVKKTPIIKSNQPIFIVGMGRSGTTILAEAMSCHEHVFWLSNFQNRFPKMPLVSTLNRIVDGQAIGINLRSKRNKRKGMLGKAFKCLPFVSEAHYIWAHYCGDYFPVSFLLGQQADALQAKRLRFFIGSDWSVSWEATFLP